MSILKLIPIGFVFASLSAQSATQTVRLKELVSLEGVRDNQLIGYGIVVGLNGTGDKRQTLFTAQSLTNMLQQMGVAVPPSFILVRNTASAMVTATLPPFAQPGSRIDATVAAIGDAASLQGGLLLMTSLRGIDGQVYSVAQGPVVTGGFIVGATGTTQTVNHPTVGRIPSGGLVERDSSVDLEKMNMLTILLSEPNFTTAEQVAVAINREFHGVTAKVKDSRRIEVARGAEEHDVPLLLSGIENLSVEVRRRARVVVNERTGTVVMGRDVRLGAVSILHGSFSIEVTTTFAVSQPEALSRGETKVIPDTSVHAQEEASRRIELNEGASVDQLVNGLQKIGATSRDVIAILQAIKASGALDADLEVI